MSLIRRLPLAVATTALLTAAALAHDATRAPASAAEVTTNVEQISVLLYPPEAWAVQIGFGDSVCRTKVLPELRRWLTIPLSAETCADGLTYCSTRVAAGEPSLTRFDRDGWECLAVP